MRDPRKTLSRAAAIGTMCAVVGITACAPRAPHAGAVVPHGRDAASYLLIQEPDSTFEPILGVIKSATKSIRMEMYELVSPAAIRALVDTHKRGVATKVLLDAAYHGRAANQRAFNTLQAAGVDARWAPDNVIFHEKAIIADDATVAVGTGNLSGRRFEATSRDFWVLDTSPADVAAISETFDQDFGGGSADRAAAGVLAPGLIWSPDSRRSFLTVIAATRRTLSITSEEFTDTAISSAVAGAAGRGVKCRVILNDDAGTTSAVDEVRAAGCAVRLVPASEHGLFMHAKVILADDQLVVGSQNLAPKSLLDNRELSLLLDTRTAPDVVPAVQHTFDTDFAAASAG